MLRGIDVSGYQPCYSTYSSGYVETAYSGSDFVIAKATQGTRPLNSHMVRQLERAKADGKLIGVYHYAEGGSPVAEADAFISCVKDYIGQAILCLDWENGDNDAWGSTTWARQFVGRVHALTGIYPLVYTYPAGRSQVASCADVSALWIAGYPDNRFSWELPQMIYNTGAWSDWTIWQYSSANGNIDLNVAQLDSTGWVRLAEGDKAATGFTPHWVHNSVGWWYATAPNDWYADTWQLIGGEWYYFDANGYAAKGWVRYGAYWCYMRETADNRECAMETGFIEVNGSKYYLYPTSDNAPRGTMAVGKFEVDGKTYITDASGRIQKSAVVVHDGLAYALDTDGTVKSGTLSVSTDETGAITKLN